MTIEYNDNYWLLRIIRGASAITIGQTVHVRESVKKLPPVIQNGILAHEAVHCAQYRQHSIAGYILQYLFRPSFRLRMETPAMAAEARIWINAGYDPDISLYIQARSLSGGFYGRMCTMGEAVVRIKMYI